MALDFPEVDWKHLRALHPVALDRYCARIVEESAAIVADSAVSPHERYLRLYRLIRERDSSISTAFDDLRRSTAVRRLASMIELDLLSSDELNGFTPQTRDTAIGLSELLQSPKSKRVRGHR
jgi:hypothetical protein